MPNLLALLSEMLESGETEARQDALLIVKYLFEREAGNESLAGLARDLAPAGVVDWGLSKNELASLRNATMELLKIDIDASVRVACVFALRSCLQPPPKEFLVDLLEEAYLSGRDACLVHELLIALVDRGEPVLSRLETSILDTAGDLKDARSYLRSQGRL